MILKQTIPSAVRVISFDLDDTLWSGSQVIMQAEKMMLSWMHQHTPRVLENLSTEALRNKKIEFIQLNHHLSNKISDARQIFLQQLFSEFDYEQPEKLAQDCFDVFYHARQQVILFDDVLDVLTHLKKEYRLIAITNGNANIEIIGLDHLFEFCLQAEDFDRPKPHRDMFDHALERVGYAAHEVLHVGDHPVQDMQGAYHAGIQTCWLDDRSHQWGQDFTPVMTIQHIRELL